MLMKDGFVSLIPGTVPTVSGCALTVSGILSAVSLRSGDPRSGPALNAVPAAGGIPGAVLMVHTMVEYTKGIF